MSEPPHTTPEITPEIAEAIATVERVTSITLTGAPSLIVLDAGAIWEGDDGTTDAVADAVADGITRALGVLARQGSAHIVVRGARAEQRATLERVIPTDQLELGAGPGPADLSAHGATGRECLAIFATPDARVPDGGVTFYCGPGAPPAHTTPTRLAGPTATASILALYGTALVQERAGIAFRGTSGGQGIPRAGHFPPDIFLGVARAAGRPDPPAPADRQPLPDAAALRALAGAAYARLLRNVLPNGAVVGAPARGAAPCEPNYRFYWQRDGAVTMRHLIAWHEEPPLGLETGGLGSLIGNYLRFVGETQQRGHQGTSRYSVAGEPILGYGNPQLDGPALSALALARLPEPARGWAELTRYLDFLLTPEGRGPTMDAWEFIFGRLFNAELLKRRALLAGAAVAVGLRRMADAARYREEARRLGASLADFLDPQRGRLVSSRGTYNPWFETISGLDMAVIAAYLSDRDGRARGTDPGREDDGALGRDLEDLAHPAVLATMMALEDAFASLYPVNRAWRGGGNAGWGLGRFPEDANDGLGSAGGNPWPLATLWGAQFYYLLAQEVAEALAAAPALIVDDPRQVAFFGRVAGDTVEWGRPLDAATWRGRVLPALLARGDAYLNFVVHHTPADGGVTEQIDGQTGAPRGARDLSWALSELIATIALRERMYSIV